LDAVSVAALASAVLTILSVMLGTKYRDGKAKAKQLAKLLANVVEAAEDNEVTEDEFHSVVEAAKVLLNELED
jgi:hypothetical protein